MSVADGTTTPTATATITWRHKIYWGKVDLSAISNPDLTLHPGLSPSVVPYCDDDTIKALTGAGVGTGSDLVTSYSKTYTDIDGGGQYLVFAHPTVFGAKPKFLYNGLNSVAFTKVRSNDDFVTDTGLVVKYDVWIRNTQDFSPTTIIIS